MPEDYYSSLPTYDRTQAEIRRMREKHRALKVFPIGRSVLGRDINALCIGAPAGATLFVGATHGLEWLTGMLLIRFCSELLRAMETCGKVSDIDVRRALQSRSVVIVPYLNPDGVEIALTGAVGAGMLCREVEAMCGGECETRWQANAHGVDLNHNFDAGWRELRKMEVESGITGPGPTRYGGAHPHSEPETDAIATFCVTCQPRTLYSLHSQGEEIYYHYGSHTPARSRMMAQILASSSGYALSKPEGLASHGGLKDWFIDKFHRPGFTIEVGLGKNPLSLNQLVPIYDRIEEMLMIAAML